MQLSDYVGQEILTLIPYIADPPKLVRVILHGVEAGGVWIESQTLTNTLLATLGASAISKTPVTFLPYHQITCFVSSVDVMALNEKAFGV